MNLTQFQAVVEVIRTGSVGAAAHNLHRTSPAITSQIKALESQLNVRLFDKVGRNVVPRQEAHAVYRCAMDMLRRIEELRDELAMTDGQVRGTVSLGCGSFFARTVLPPIIADCLRRHPHLRVSIAEYSRIEELRDRLYHGDFRLLLALNTVSDSELLFDTLFEDELVLIVPQGHTLARRPREPLPPEALHGHTIIAHSYPSIFNTVFDRTGIPPEVLLRDEQCSILMRTTESVFAFVEQGAGAAFVPRYMVRLMPHRRIVMRRMTRRLPLKFGIYHLASTTFTAAEEIVVSALRKRSAKLAEGRLGDTGQGVVDAG